MQDHDIKKILEENKKLKKENRELKKMLKNLESEDIPDNNAPIINNDNSLNNNEILENAKEKDLSIYETFESKEDMSIISFLARSDKRVQILKSLSQGDKIPSIIGKEIGDSSHHVSKYLSSLKEKELVICLNEEDKRFRFYRITDEGEYYLKIIENKKY